MIPLNQDPDSVIDECGDAFLEHHYNLYYASYIGLKYFTRYYNNTKNGQSLQRLVDTYNLIEDSFKLTDED